MSTQPIESVLLRIYIDEGDRHEHRPLYEWILQAALKEGLAGATVLRGTAGFGADRHPHSNRVLSLSNSLPLVVEIVDTVEKIEAFRLVLDPVLVKALVTTEKVTGWYYKG